MQGPQDHFASPLPPKATGQTPDSRNKDDGDNDPKGQGQDESSIQVIERGRELILPHAEDLASGILFRRDAEESDLQSEDLGG